MPKANGNAKQPDPRVDKLVAQYIAIRTRIAELEKNYKKQIEPFEQAKNKLAGILLEFLDTTGQESAKTAEGTVYATVKHYASLADPDAFMDYVMKNGLFELMDRRANSTACRDHIEEHGKLPPGVNLNSIRTVGVRAS